MQWRKKKQLPAQVRKTAVSLRVNSLKKTEAAPNEITREKRHFSTPYAGTFRLNHGPELTARLPPTPTPPIILIAPHRPDRRLGEINGIPARTSSAEFYF